MHELVNNEAVFYNVATLTKNRKYLLYQNGKMIGAGSVVISGNAEINLDSILQ
jgi:hypothetical protein